VEFVKFVARLFGSVETKPACIFRQAAIQEQTSYVLASTSSI